MRDEHDDDLAPTVEQRDDVETERFSELDETTRDEERDDDDADDDTEDVDVVGK
jgi:hypothetical protein